MPPTAQKTTLSRGLLIRDEIVKLLDSNKTTDTLLRLLNVGNIVTESPSDVMNPVIYVQMGGKTLSQPNTLGSVRVSYSEVYSVHLTYIHSRIDRRISDELIVAMDVLTEFFEQHGNLNGLSNIGVIVRDSEIKAYMDSKFIYNAVSIDVLVPLARRRDRNL